MLIKNIFMKWNICTIHTDIQFIKFIQFIDIQLFLVI